MALMHPESDLSMSLPVWGADVIRQLHAGRHSVLVDSLLDHWLRLDRRRTSADFFNTLDFLYALGVIEREGYRICLAQLKASQMSLFDDPGGRNE